MTEGRAEAPAAAGTPNNHLWLHIFRCFTVALDPRKLFAAGLGILVTAFGWFVLSTILYGAFGDKPLAGNADYGTEAMKRTLGPKKADGTTDYTAEDYEAKGKEKYESDLARWTLVSELAGEGGKLRTMPWYEFRGENPYLFATRVLNQPPATWFDEVKNYLGQQIPVLTEPLHKLLIPIVKLTDPNASFGTRIYLLACLLWSILVWAFFGGLITRLAAVQLGGHRTTIKQTVLFVGSRYIAYVLSPIVPLGVIALIVLVMFIYGLVALIPIVGDLVSYGLLFPLIIFGGIAMAVILLGLLGYPLMYTTISVEGSDTFDAVSRSYNYVFQAPWSFLWYSFLAMLYGAAVTFVVIIVGCLMMILGKWAIGSSAGITSIESRRPDFLYIHAPESLGWKELLLKGSPVAVKRKELVADNPITKKPEVVYDPATKLPVLTTQLVPENEARSKQYMSEMRWWNYAAAAMACFWMMFFFLLMIGFSYSYFWTAYTVVYLLMRKKVDEVEIDEVFIEDAIPPMVNPAPVPPAPPASAPPPGGVSLTVVPPPPPVPAPVPPVEPPAAT